MDTFVELDDRKKIVALLRVLLARCTEQAVTPYLTAYRRKLQTLVNRQSKRVIQECIVEAVHTMTTPKPEAYDEDPESNETGGAHCQSGMQGLKDSEMTALACMNKMKEIISACDGDVSTLEAAFSLTASHSSSNTHAWSCVMFLRVLVTCMAEGRFEKAALLQKELVGYIEAHVQTDATSLEMFAFSLTMENKLLEAICFYKAACFYYSKRATLRETAVGFSRCLHAFAEINSRLVENKESYKTLAKAYVMPFVYKMLPEIFVSEVIDKRFRCLVEATCLFAVSLTEGVLSEFDAKVVTLNKAIKRMKEAFGEKDASSLTLYGSLHLELGQAFFKLLQIGPCIKCCMQSREVFEKVEDTVVEVKLFNILRAEEALAYCKSVFSFYEMFESSL